MADDPYSITDQVDSSMLEMMVARLEERGRDARFLGMIDDYLDAAGISEAKDVLDLGCASRLKLAVYAPSLLSGMTNLH